MQVSDWKAATKDGLGVASRFLQTLITRVPDCVDITNPVKMAFSIAKVILEIKDVGCCFCILGYDIIFHQIFLDSEVSQVFGPVP